MFINNENMNPKKIKIMYIGDSFGTLSFFTGDLPCVTIKSLDFCTFLVIKRNDFINILK